MTPPTRWERLHAALDAGLGHGESYCAVVASVVGADGVALTLVATAERPQVCVTDPTSALLEDLQFTTGEGPSVDADATGLVVVADDLAGAADGARWPAFAPAAAADGRRGAFAVPMRVGAARLGVLTLYYRDPRQPGGEAYADALVLAELLARDIVRTQSAAPDGTLAPALVDAGAHRAQVHQAAGMLSVQLGLTILDALVWLRTYAYAANRPVNDVAAEVVARTLKFEP